MSPLQRASVGDDPAFGELHRAGNGVGREHMFEIQRTRMLTAMVEMVAEHGAANVTVAHVVKRSGVSRRTFYEIFVDREECFLAAFDDGIARVRECVLEAYRAEGRWRERVRAGLVALLEFLDQEQGLGRLLIVESLGAGPGALERRSQILPAAIAAVDAGVTEGKAVEQPPLTAEGIVGGVLAVLHARLLDPGPDSLLELTGPLMSMIVRPYLGQAAAQRELLRPTPVPRARSRPPIADPLRDLEMRLTYRTMCVLTTLANNPGSSNRDVGLTSGIQDQGQISKLLTRLQKLGLIENTGAGRARGAPNAWMLTHKGQEIQRAIG